MSAPIHTWSAWEVVQAIRQGDLTVQHLAEALVERYDDMQSDVRAFVWFDRDRLLASARALDMATKRGPLHGLPIAVKDNIDTVGIPSQYGSPIYAGHVPAADAAVVALARASGAYVLGKTVTTEFAVYTPGPTRNPRNLAHTPGGSSSGSAAAVAACMAPVALGTQTAGSVIRPAAYCGVVGYKPSPRLIPRAGVKASSDSLDEVGVIARSVDDVGLVGGVLALLRPNSRPSTRAFAPQIGVTLTSRSSAASDATKSMIIEAAKRLSKAGAQVADAVWPAAFDTVFDAQRTIHFYELARALAFEWEMHRDLLSPGIIGVLTEGRAIDGARYAAAIETARSAFAAIETLFAGRDVLITPAAPGDAPPGLESTGDPIFNRPWQVMRCPCVTVPFGIGERGLPLGVQIVARPGDDARLLAAAAWIETQLNGVD